MNDTVNTSSATAIPVFQHVRIEQMIVQLKAQLVALNIITDGPTEDVTEYDPRLVLHYQAIFRLLPSAVLTAKRNALMEQLKVLYSWQEDEVDIVAVHHTPDLRPESPYQITLRAEQRQHEREEAEAEEEEEKRENQRAADEKSFNYTIHHPSELNFTQEPQ